jgi:hypothetical protein
VPSPPRPRKKPRGTRACLTHIEVRRGDVLRVRIAISDDALTEGGNELGALIRKIAPSTKPAVVAEPVVVADVQGADEDVADFLISRQHTDDDGAYHAGVREHLAGLFSSLCDTSLADALALAREESARRAEGGN